LRFGASVKFFFTILHTQLDFC